MVIHGPNAAADKTNIYRIKTGSLEFIPNDASQTDFGIEFISEDRKDKNLCF